VATISVSSMGKIESSMPLMASSLQVGVPKMPDSTKLNLRTSVA